MRTLLGAATVLNGLLAGATADRFLIGIPALRKLGPLTWGQYSRHADLSPAGAAFYPTLAIGGTILTIADAVRSRQPMATVAAASALAGLLFTFKAAPNMLVVRHLGNDAKALQKRMDKFVYWSTFRGTLQVAAFFACVCALSEDRA
jgi:hypothetical protein